MGALEASGKKIRRRGEVERAVLLATANAGLLAYSATASHSLSVLSYTPKNEKRFLYQAKTAAVRLEQKGLLTFVESGGKKYLRLTPEGRVAFEVMQARAAGHKKPKKWDRRFRMVIFDIPEEKRRLRDRFRRIVVEAGFLKLQNSVFVYPYDCEELMVLIKANLRIGKEVLYLVVEKIENDGPIRKHFALPPRD